MARWTMPLALGLALALGDPARADMFDGVDNDGDGQIDEADEDTRGGLQPNRLEAECQATARPEVCLMYFELWCQQGFGQACQMAALGQSCRGGDPGQCQIFVQILQANTACSFGDPNACGWLRSQGLGG